MVALSANDAATTQLKIPANATNTGLSPEFHLTFLINGMAALFFSYFNQSSKNHFSNCISLSSEFFISSKNSFTSPLALLLANSVRF